MRIYLIVSFIIFFTINSYASGVILSQQEMKKTKQLKIEEQQKRRKSLDSQNSTDDPIKRVGAFSRDVDPDYVSASRYGYSEEVVNIEDLWYELESSSEIWERIIEEKPKEATIDMYISWYKEKGIIISKPAASYVKIIDDLVAKNPNILHNSFKDILKIAAIIEYDFKNGQDSDALAKKVLGEEAYKKNKKRLGK